MINKGREVNNNNIHFDNMYMFVCQNGRKETNKSTEFMSLKTTKLKHL